MAGTSVFKDVDRSNPCALLEVMEATFDRLLAGEVAVQVRFGDEEVRYQPSDIPALRVRIEELRSQCAAQRAGGRRIGVVYINASKGL